ncbi:hypothetical protein PPL_01802 [Heterostelium album PN500]|uniref:Uncharacterized protein n=1 Tax=Heterostelium pallidum (strain ATCC 26659 / Pp 5 / PN500) TaxID=670386 RepID=D3B0I5_HETP5|nr:hypothetical protein PPL_01802 [Heterostelium album PN500]EFA84809.1 hypothetical protein PPL_01802 [Heterostelium album PN500]|eukprot:XP_020436920.1 hypothetical protein PPL_01802 [Heterostelium album PN500]
MIRQTLRLFSAAATAAAKPAAAVAATNSNMPEPMVKFFSDENLRTADLPVFDNSNISKMSDDEFELHFNKVMNNPLFQTDSELMRAYRDYEASLRAMDQYKPLPEIAAAKSMNAVNWEFKKNFVPAKTVDYIRDVFQQSIDSIDSWEAEENKIFADAEKQIEEAVRPLQTLVPEIQASLDAIQAQLVEADDFKNRLKTVTIEEILKKNPEIENEIYDEITTSEWMIKDKTHLDQVSYVVFKVRMLSQSSLQNTQKFQQQQSTFQNQPQPQQQQQQQQRQTQPTSPNQNVIDHQTIVGRLTTDFESRMSEWKQWTFISFSFWYSLIIFIQMITLSKFTSSSFNVWYSLIYVGFQLILNVLYGKTVGVYRQVPASFGEMFSSLSVYHCLFIGSIVIGQPILLLSLFNLAPNTFTFSTRIIDCTLQTVDGECYSYSNPFFYIYLFTSIAIIAKLLYKMLSNFENILSFPKIQFSLFQQSKQAIYNCIWNSFVESSHLCFGVLFYGVILLILFSTLPIRIIPYVSKLWLYALVLFFQQYLRQILYEIFYTRSIRFVTDKFTNVTIDNNNVFLLQGLGSIDPLIQHHAWRDFLHLSQHSTHRRAYLFNEIKQLVDMPSIIKIVQEYDRMMRDLINKLQCPPEYYYQQKQQQQQENSNNNNNNSKSNEILNNLLLLLGKYTGISLEFDVYECEIRQSLSNTQPLVWAIEAIAAFILSAFVECAASTRETRENAVLIHKYQIIQKFLTPLVELMAVLDRLEMKNVCTTTLKESSVIPDPFLIKTLLRTNDLPPTCLGVLSTVRPHFRLLKYVGKNTITQILDRVGNQLSDSSFPLQYRQLFKEYRTGETFIYTKVN